MPVPLLPADNIFLDKPKFERALRCFSYCNHGARCDRPALPYERYCGQHARKPMLEPPTRGGRPFSRGSGKKGKNPAAEFLEAQYTPGQLDAIRRAVLAMGE